MPSRTPPKAIQRQLRREVHYGCPVEGCGSPYLSYHHFDPPYHVGRTHDPNGMIALCLAHHKQADGGAYTIEQLLEMKRHPYLEMHGSLHGASPWRRRDVIFDCGGMFAAKTQTLLTTKSGEKSIWLRQDKSGYMLLNLDIKDTTGTSVLQMTDNSWEIHGPLTDFETKPSGNNLYMKSKEIVLSLEFKQADCDAYREMIRDSFAKSQANFDEPPRWLQDRPDLVEFLNAWPPTSVEEKLERHMRALASHKIEWPALYVCLRGRLCYPSVIEFRDGEMVFRPNNITFRENTVIGGTAVMLA